MGVINAATLAILGFLLVRKLVLMDRFFAARVCLITAVLYGLLFLAFSYVMTDATCCVPLPSPNGSAFLLTEV